MKILAITGSYRNGGIIHQAVDELERALGSRGHETERIDLLGCRIGFCTNCRRCTQNPGPEVGRCPLDDDMGRIIAAIESADALILASPVNFGSATALYKRFLERLTGYGYWPWGAPAPKFRRSPPTKKAILITSSAAPGIMARLSSCTMNSLRYTAKVVGARPVSNVCIGFAAQSEAQTLNNRNRRLLLAAAAKLGADA